jgi:hypothetical protein
VNSKLDFCWRVIDPTTVGGQGVGVSFLIRTEEEGTYTVYLMHRGSFLAVRRTFSSVMSARRWCERYFGV